MWGTSNTPDLKNIVSIRDHLRDTAVTRTAYLLRHEPELSSFRRLGTCPSV